VEAIEQAANAAIQVEAASHAIAIKTRAKIDGGATDESSTLDLSRDLETLKEGIQSLEDNLDQAAKMLAIPTD
jgi:predicted  nucleic acid-binding Zn-ribbon protein